MTEAMKGRDFIQEALQNFKDDYNSLIDPTYCNINVGFGSLKRGINTVHDSHSIKIEHHDDFHYERIDGVIKKFIQMSSIPSMKGRRSTSLNIIIGISVRNIFDHYSGRTYEVQLQENGNLTLIDFTKGNS